jgi:hypothetical protein
MSPDDIVMIAIISIEAIQIIVTYLLLSRLIKELNIRLSRIQDSISRLEARLGKISEAILLLSREGDSWRDKSSSTKED